MSLHYLSHIQIKKYVNYTILLAVSERVSIFTAHYFLQSYRYICVPQFSPVGICVYH